MDNTTEVYLFDPDSKTISLGSANRDPLNSQEAIKFAGNEDRKYLRDCSDIGQRKQCIGLEASLLLLGSWLVGFA